MLANSKITVGGASIWSKYNYDAFERIGLTETLNDGETLGVKHNLSCINVGTNEHNRACKFSYEYNNVGNITDIKGINSNPNKTIAYSYDLESHVKDDSNLQRWC